MSDSWNRRYQFLKSFTERFGKFPYGKKHKHLVLWISQQKSLFETEKLSEEKINLLSEIPNWSWDPCPARWDRSYEKLERFVRDTDCVPVSQDIKIGRWVLVQRKEYAKGTLAKHRVIALERIKHWNWGRVFPNLQKCSIQSSESMPEWQYLVRRYIAKSTDSLEFSEEDYPVAEIPELKSEEFDFSKVFVKVESEFSTFLES